MADDIEKAKHEWEANNAYVFEHERKKEFTTLSGIPIKRCYTPLDLVERGFDYCRDLGFPGSYPFTRGIYPSMYRGNLWDMGVTTGRPTPEESNKLWKEQISSWGVTSIYIQYDLPSALGYDPGDPSAEGEVGRVGLSLASQRDWEIALDGIDVGKIPFKQIYNALAPVGLANHLLIAKKQGADLKKLRGNIQNDILKDYTARGTYIFPPAQGLRVTIDTMVYCAENLPSYQLANVQTYQFHEKGADSVHEIAFGLADMFTYIEQVVDRGVDVDVVAPGITSQVVCNHYNFFEDIAKSRATRRIYAKVMRERFKAKKPESMRLWLLTPNAGQGLFREQYLNNIARTAISLLAGVLGGSQWFDMRPYDEAFGTPTEEAMSTNLQTQRIVAEETGVADTIDPLAGSYYVESLTSELEERIWKELENIEKRGGTIKCIEDGYFERVMVEGAYKAQKAFDSGELVKVGVNRYTSAEEQRPSRVYRADPAVEQQRIEAIRELKRKRDNRKVKKALDDVKAVALMKPGKDSNLVPPIMEALRVYATAGEIAGALREVWGEWTRVFHF